MESWRPLIIDISSMAHSLWVPRWTLGQWGVDVALNHMLSSKGVCIAQHYSRALGVKSFAEGPD